MDELSLQVRLEDAKMAAEAIALNEAQQRRRVEFSERPKVVAKLATRLQRHPMPIRAQGEPRTGGRGVGGMWTALGPI